MKKFFEKYANEAAYEAANNKWPHVSYIVGTDEVKYEAEPIDYSKQYFTTVALGSGDITFSGSSATNLLSYSTDEGSTWTTMTAQSESVTVNEGDRVMWKGTATPVYYVTGIGKFTATANFNVEGNVMSLFYGDNFQEQTDLASKNYALSQLFGGNRHLISAENLVLPATTLASYCYREMFNGCANLTTAPELPATTLASSCYNGMFGNCESLTTVPELPATTLAWGCYSGMFGNCTSLTTAQTVLPATTLANECYNGMFSNCISLTTAPQLPATTLTEKCYFAMFNTCRRLNSITCLATDISASNCTYDWAYIVSSTGTFTKAASMNDWPSGATGIPNGWTVQDYQG